MNEWLGLGVFIIVCIGAGAVGGLATMSSVDDWYLQIEKPTWTPPSWVFGPVWTTLYIAMGIAGWLVWRHAGFEGAKDALGLFGAQLVLNVGWSVAFFGLQAPGLAVIVILLLLGLIVATALRFRPFSGLAAGLMVPYIAWVSFATALNIAIWRLNA